MGERYVAVSYQLLNQILREGNELHLRLRQGLPEGAELVRIEEEPPAQHPDAEASRGCLLWFRSAEWPELPEGVREAVMVVVQQLDCELPIGPATASWARTALRDLAEAAYEGHPELLMQVPPVDVDELNRVVRYLGTKAAGSIERMALEPKAKTNGQED